MHEERQVLHAQLTVDRQDGLVGFVLQLQGRMLLSDVRLFSREHLGRMPSLTLLLHRERETKHCGMSRHCVGSCDEVPVRVAESVHQALANACLLGSLSLLRGVPQRQHEHDEREPARHQPAEDRVVHAGMVRADVPG